MFPVNRDINMVPDLAHVFKSTDDDSNSIFTECKYYLPNDIVSIKEDYHLKIMHLNIHSVASKLSDLKDLLATLAEAGKEIDIILLCETFITDNNLRLCSLPGYNLEEKHRSSKLGGGVAVYVNSRIKYKCRDDLSIFDEGKFESCFIEVTCKNKNAVIGELYRVPNSSESEFQSKYESIVSKVCHENKNLVIGTDQNLDLLKCNIHTNTSNFLNFNLSAGLLPMLTKPTRITHQTATLIDNFYINSSITNDSRSAILVSDISDHFPCLLFMKKEYVKQKDSLEFSYRKLNEESITRIKADLSNVDWSCLNNTSMNESYEFFSDKISQVQEKHAPLKIVKIPPKYVIRDPWMTQALIKSSQTCHNMYSKVKDSDRKSPEFVAFKQYRNQYNVLKRQMKNQYYASKIEEFKNDSAKLWKLLNALIGKTSDKSSLTDTFLINGNLCSDPTKISNEFCNYFTNVGKNLASQIPDPNISYRDYLRNNNYPDSLFFSPVVKDEVVRIVNSLKSKKSFGHDYISNILLKEIVHEIVEPLTFLINKSLLTGTFPDSMKIAKVIPFYKSKDKRELNNYRPISLLPVLSKVLEKVVYNRLYNFLLRHNILYDSQYGFRNSHSTVNAISELTAKILNGFDKREYTLAVFLDLSKAFDTINHKILINKLEYYGVRGVVLDWFKSYLNTRKQYVEYNNVKSDLQKIDCGVPQGSVLGPLLFIIYMNDLPRCLKKCLSILFADDTTIYITGKNKRELFQDMKNDIAMLIEWFQVNKLSLNLAKTQYILFNPKGVNLENDENVDDDSLSFGTDSIAKVLAAKFLGLHVDQHLDWSAQYKHLNSKLVSANYILKAVKNILDAKCRRMLYFSLFQSHLMYGICNWGPILPAGKIKRLNVSQRKAVRSICRAKYNAHTNPLFAKTKILKMADLTDLEILKLMYLYSKSTLPTPLMNLFQNMGPWAN